MAIIETTEPIRKKIGDLVFYTLRGQQIVRSRPVHYTDAKTEAQLSNRLRISLLSTYLSNFLEYIRAVNFSSSAYNRLVSLNYKTCFEGSYPSIIINKEKVKISSGDLSPLLSFDGYIEGNNLLLTWDYEEDFEDELFVCFAVFYPSLESSSFYYNVCSPVEHGYIINNIKDNNVVVYSTVVSDIACSDSSYLTKK